MRGLAVSCGKNGSHAEPEGPAAAAAVAQQVQQDHAPAPLHQAAGACVGGLGGAVGLAGVLHPAQVHLVFGVIGVQLHGAAGILQRIDAVAQTLIGKGGKIIPPCIASGHAVQHPAGLRVAAIDHKVAGLNMVPNGLLLKDQRFISIGIRLFVVTVVGGVIAIVMAFAGWGVYALVWHNIIAGLITFLWNYLSRPIRHLTIHFMASLKKVFSYSVFQFGSSMVNYFSTNLPNLVIGKAFNEVALGFYDKAYRLTTYPLNGVSNVIISVIQPYMAKHQDDLKALFSYWFKIAKALSLIGIPITVIFFCAPEEIVGIMYGDQWGSAVPLLQLLSICIYFQMVNSVSGAFFLSAGKADLLFRSVCMSTILTVCGLVIGIAFGSLEAVALCLSVAFCLHVIPSAYYLLKRTLHEGYRCVVKFLPEIGIGLIAGAACLLLTPFMPDNIILSLLCKMLVVLGVIALGYLATRQYGYIKAILRKG